MSERRLPYRERIGLSGAQAAEDRQIIDQPHYCNGNLSPYSTYRTYNPYKEALAAYRRVLLRRWLARNNMPVESVLPLGFRELQAMVRWVQEMRRKVRNSV